MSMMRRSQKPCNARDAEDDAAYFVYRPLSNLPTPPPSSRQSRASSATPEDGELLTGKYLGPAVHLVNLIPSSASLATASISRVQSMLTKADLPLETVALAVCILDSLDCKFARKWRLSCPLRSRPLGRTTSKRHTLPPNLLCSTPILQQPPQMHIDSVSPELIIMAALVIAVKFNDDLQSSTRHYCEEWGHHMWSHEQLNLTERLIMESLGYRIMPLTDEDCITDAMVDMQLAARQPYLDLNQQATPPDSVLGDDVPSPFSFHTRSKTMSTGIATLGLDNTWTPADTPGPSSYQSGTPQPQLDGPNYFELARP
jgi:hypothetical protein